MKNKLKRFWAVFAGFFTVFFLSTATDVVLEQTGVFPPIADGHFVTWMLVLAFAYRSLYTIVGGYVTAKLAPEDPKRLVKVLAIVGTCAGIIGIFAGWNLSDHWYPIALAVTAYPLVTYGGKLRMKRQNR